MITQTHIDNAKSEEDLVKHVLAPSGLAKMGETNVNDETIIIFLDSETNELIASQLEKPLNSEMPDYSLFADAPEFDPEAKR